MNQLIIDGENAVLGRLASYVAKQTLSGKEIRIVNCDKIVIVGNEQSIIEDYKTRKARGGAGLAGPFFPFLPERIVKRTIRNMLSYKQERGRLALKRVKCYSGIPEEFKDKKMIKGKGKKGMTLAKLSDMMGGK